MVLFLQHYVLLSNIILDMRWILLSEYKPYNLYPVRVPFCFLYLFVLFSSGFWYVRFWGIWNILGYEYMMPNCISTASYSIWCWHYHIRLCSSIYAKHKTVPYCATYNLYLFNIYHNRVAVRKWDVRISR